MILDRRSLLKHAATLPVVSSLPRIARFHRTIIGCARLREGRPVTINVINDARYTDIVHWHGLYLPAVEDGATEGGSPIIPVGQSACIPSRPSQLAHAGITATPWP